MAELDREQRNKAKELNLSLRYGFQTHVLHTGCSLNIVGFFPKILKHFGLWPFSVSPRCQCVYTVTGQTPALQQNLRS